MRDLRIDVFRGMALLMIFIDHVPGNDLSAITLQSINICDAAEVFVLLAGISAAIGLSGCFERASWIAAAARLWLRCWNLYVAHVVMFVVVTCIIVSAARAFENPLYIEQINLLPFLHDTETAIVRALGLTYQPNFLDILPLYIVLIFFTPVLLPLALRAPHVLFAGSLLLYAAVQFYPFNLPNYPGDSGWTFNPFAWQFLYVIGLLIGARSHKGCGFDQRFRGEILVAAGLIVIIAFAIAAPWRRIPSLADVVLIPWSWLPPISKTDLSIVRLLNILAWFCLAGLLARPDGRLVASRAGRLLAMLGAYSLPVFAVGIIASVIGNVVLLEAGRGIGSQVLVNTVGMLVMLLVAWIASWLASEPWRVPRASAQTKERAYPAASEAARRSLVQPCLVLCLLLASTAPALAAPTSTSSTVRSSTPVGPATKGPADNECAVPLEYLRFDHALPHAKAKVREGGTLEIVALGSSSTQGAGDSKPGADYPSRLQEELQARFPHVTVEVSNRGVGGQTAEDMVERLETDVLSEDPALVIWQAGVNDALEDVPVEHFKDVLRYGIETLHENGIDVILMDMQWYAALRRLPNYHAYLEAMDDVAAAMNVPMFRRFDIMRTWAESGTGDSEDFSLSDHLHMPDWSYNCLAIDLAIAIEAALR